MKKKNPKKKKGKFSTILLVLIFLAGLSLLLYPTVSDYWNSFHSSRAVANYTEQVNDLNEEEYAAMLAAASAYNAQLATEGYAHEPTDEQLAEYNSLLSVGTTDVMGYIEIPTINVSLPIYHGTDESVLQVGVGHLNWSSLPVGGASTHCVLSGHRGLPSAKLFSNLDKLVVGDTFTIKVLNETLTYEVDQILIVLPEDLQDLQIEEGQDLCTLVTCTPYGINTHRLLVRGHRVENVIGAAEVHSEAMKIPSYIVAPAVAIPILFVLLVLLLAFYRKPATVTTQEIRDFAAAMDENDEEENPEENNEE